MEIVIESHRAQSAEDIAQNDLMKLFLGGELVAKVQELKSAKSQSQRANKKLGKSN